MSKSERRLSLGAARRACAAAEQEAQVLGARISVAVLDDGGHLVLFARMEGTHVGTVEVAMGKARTAIYFRKPTADFADALSRGATALISLPNMLPIPGGVPLVQDDTIVGAVGISGAAPDVDARIAAAAAASLNEGVT